MKFQSKLAGIVLASAVTVTAFVAVQGPATAKPQAKPPVAVSGEQAKPDIEAGSKDQASPAIMPLGPTKLLTLDAEGRSAEVTSKVAPLAGNDASVDFSTVYKYCQGNLVYTTVRNWSAVTKYFRVDLSANGSLRTFYTSVAAGGTAYPTWYGVSGTFYAYLYVWNGTSYAYDEYLTNSNNCSVSLTWTVSTAYPGYILMTLRNNGNSYASVDSNELAPFPGAGAYTGRHWDYPAPGGGVVNRYYYVGKGLKFGLYADLYGANGYSPWYRYGTL